jgi:hypothetical protein
MPSSKKLVFLPVALLLFMGACKSVNRQGLASYAVTAKSEPLIEAATKKDNRILESADRIDAAVSSDPGVESVVKPETTEIRDAVASVPAREIEELIKVYEKHLASQAKEIERLHGQVSKLQGSELRWQARGLTGLGIAMALSFGVSVAFGGGLLAAAKTWPLLLIGVGALGLAQIVSHPWFMPSMAALLVASLGYVVYYIWDRNSEGRLKSSLDKKVALLAKIIPVLDEARENATGHFKTILDKNIFSRFSRDFNRDEKVLVHDVRKQLKGSQ